MIIKLIANNEGKRVPLYMKKTNMAESTLVKYLRQLKKAGLIEFKGEATKSGGYFLTKK